MLTPLHGQSANDVWIQAFRKISKSGLRQTGRGGTTRELLHVTLSIEDPTQRWIHSRSPAINTALAVAEIIWIITGRNDRRFLSYWSQSLKNFVGNSRALHGAYGHRLVHQFGFDQLSRAAHILESKPDSRQIVLQIWDPTKDLPFRSGKERNRDIPCNVLSMLKIRNGRLEWMQIMRSNDLFRGLPYNLVQFTSMQEIISGWLGLAPGTFNQVSDSLHIYESDLKNVGARFRIIPRNTDSLALPRRHSKAAFSSLSRFGDQLINGIPKSELNSHINSPNLPPAYHNMKLVLIAEYCRKLGWQDLADKASLMCSNLALATSWHDWRARFRAR